MDILGKIIVICISDPAHFGVRQTISILVNIVSLFASSYLIENWIRLMSSKNNLIKLQMPK